MNEEMLKEKGGKKRWFKAEEKSIPERKGICGRKCAIEKKTLNGIFRRRL